MWRRRFLPLLAAWLMVWTAPVDQAVAQTPTAEYVIQISVDGLGGTYLRSLLSTPQASVNDPYYNFNRFVTEGAYTYNARNDYDYTITLPNHTSQLTGRPVLGAGGHNVTFNDDNATNPDTLQLTPGNNNTYVKGVFDVVHDAGRSTGFYATKDKFNFLIRSWNATYQPVSKLDQVTNLTADASGIDRSQTMVNDFVSDMGSAATRSNYSFVHFHNPDTAGHASGWGGTAYNNAVAKVDDYLAQIFTLVDTNAALKGKTAIILTSDHGGTGTGHSTATDALDYVIPFMVWGPTVTPGTDLYLLNTDSRQIPGTQHIVLGPNGQPIYNGEAANLGLSLLGMNSIVGSTHNLNQSLKVTGLRQIAIAGTGFSEVALGADDYVANGSSKEIGFTTNYTVPGGATSTQVGTRTSGSSLYSPVLTHRSASATTTFDTIDLDGYSNVRVSLDIRIDTTTHETGDFVKVTVTNGVQTLTVVDLQGLSSATDALDQMANGTNSGYYNFSLLLPDAWQQATLVIQSFSNSGSSGAERYDFDNILFTAATPEPAGMALMGFGAFAALTRRRRRPGHISV